MMNLRNALNRTLLLMRDELQSGASEAALLSALVTTEVALVADALTLASPAAQTAFVTTAILCARSGHRIWLVAPDVPLAGKQPPLGSGGLIGALMSADGNIVPGSCFIAGVPCGPVDVEIRFGPTLSRCAAKASFILNADDWCARLSVVAGAAWSASLSWPMGAMGGAGLAASEVFKAAMRKLRSFALNRPRFDELLAPAADVALSLAPPNAPTKTEVGEFDVISGGAITNATLYALSRIPGIRGHARVFEPDIAETTNLNRYMLLLFSDRQKPKVQHLHEQHLGGLSIQPMPMRFDSAVVNGALRDRVLVGVDHIPTRWEVQRANPRWLSIGATTHWSAMASFHERGLPCAGCLHPYDDPAEGAIPTVAFVSFMAGLFQAAYLLRSADRDVVDQQTYLTLLRPETVWRGPVAQHRRCPVGHPNDRKAA